MKKKLSQKEGEWAFEQVTKTSNSNEVVFMEDLKKKKKEILLLQE